MSRDPAFVIPFRSSSNRRAVCSARFTGLHYGFSLLLPASSAVALSALLLLGKESADPSVVDEVRDTAKDRGNNEVQEDSGLPVCQPMVTR